jgi:hypothetical protein
MSQFTCASCGGVYEKVWSDAPTDLLCDPCYQRFMAWLKGHPVQFCPICGCRTWFVDGECEWSDGHAVMERRRRHDYPEPGDSPPRGSARGD